MVGNAEWMFANKNLQTCHYGKLSIQSKCITEFGSVNNAEEEIILFDLLNLISVEYTSRRLLLLECFL